jgi:DNA polymerase II
MFCFSLIHTETLINPKYLHLLMKAFIINSSYEVINDKTTIFLFGRLENSENFCTQIPFKPYFYVKTSDLHNVLKLINLPYEETDFINFNKEKLTKIILSKPSEIKDLTKLLHEKDILTYESDIPVIKRYLIDNDISGYIEINGGYKNEGLIDRFYTPDATIKPIPEFKTNLNVISLDIETDKTANKVYSIAIASKDIKEVHILSDAKLKNAISYNTESGLLRGFKERLLELDPDIITGWNVIDFDFIVLKKRFEYHDINFNISRTGKPLTIRQGKDFLSESKASAVGRVILDGISILKQSFLILEDYKLNTVAKKVLNKEKLDMGENFWDRFEEELEKNPQNIVDYNLLDAQLVLEILAKHNLLDLMQKKSAITGLHMDSLKGTIVALDSIYIRYARKRKIISPNSNFSENNDRITGGYVIDPKPGIYDYVGVFDFKSLYPSIIRTFNIDPFAKSDKGTITAPNNVNFSKEPAILPKILTDLWKERDKAKSQNDQIRSFVYKTIMNSFYGALANSSSRYFDNDVAGAITAFARMFIKKTAQVLKDKGFEVVYGDTDSVFVNLKVKDYSSAKKIGDEIQSDMNIYFNDFIKNEYDLKTYLELEFEKTFKVLFMPSLRGSESGAKKRYAGLLEFNDRTKKIHITGMESVRRDWTPLAKRVQLDLLKLIFNKKPIEDYLKQLIKDIKSGKYDQDLLYKKGITKELDEYTKTTPPHVKAARMLDKITSNVIEYYMTVEGPVPKIIVDKQKISLDYDHYIDKQLKPIAQTILNIYDKSFEDVIAGHKQKSLFDF